MDHLSHQPNESMDEKKVPLERYVIQCQGWQSRAPSMTDVQVEVAF